MTLANFFNNLTKSKLEKVIDEVTPFLQSPAGRDEIVKSILYSEFPLIISEYVFGINNNSCVKLKGYTDERMSLLDTVLSGPVTRDLLEQFVNNQDSAIVQHPSDGCKVFHTHPRLFYGDGSSQLERYESLRITNKQPGFSDKDICWAKKSPLGLVEYAISDYSTDTIDILSNLSLCYKNDVRVFSQLKIRLNSDGTYDSDDGRISYSNKVPLVASMTKIGIPAFLAIAFDDLRKYVIIHAVEEI